MSVSSSDTHSSHASGDAAGLVDLAGHIGERISIRMAAPDGGFQDLLGQLVTSTSVEKKSGEVVEFDPTRVVAWRLVKAPFRPAGTGAPLSHRIIELEQVAEKTWPAVEITSFGGWKLRSASGFTNRANSVFPALSGSLGGITSDLDEGLDFVGNYYRSRGLPAIFHIVPALHADLDHELELRKWHTTIEAQVMVADYSDLASMTTHLNPYQVTTWEYPNSQWLDALGNAKGVDVMSAHTAKYLLLSSDGEPIAVGRIAQHLDWAILTRIFVLPEYRGKGWSKILMKELGELGSVKKFMLQVDQKNNIAIGLYQSCGFRFHHAYRYRVQGEQ